MIVARESSHPVRAASGVPVPVANPLYQPFPMGDAARARVWSYSPRYRRPRHFHLEPELNLVAAGRGAFRAGDAELAVSAGHLLYWAPGQDHELVAASPDLQLFVIGVTLELSERVIGRERAMLAGATGLRVDPIALARLRELCTCSQESSPEGIETHVGALWREAHALQAAALEERAATQRALRSILVEPDVTRADLAQRVRSHPSELSRRFHADMRLTLTAYRARVRLLRFIQAVDDGAESLLAAALEAGFGSYSQLHRVFRRTLGTTPRAFFSGARQPMGEAFLREPLAPTAPAR